MTSFLTASAASTLAPPAIEPKSSFSLAIHRYTNYQIVDFRLPGVAVLGLDDRPPMGRGWGPSPEHLLGSALGACLGAALLRVMRAAGAEVLEIRTDVSGAIQGDALSRERVTGITVRLIPVVASRSDLDVVPSAERLAELSLVADALRPDLHLSVAITPEVREAQHRLRH
ncbi:MAG: hypothetical protein DMD35_06700 [Gemmatimonadetes bacterium]|nr:MAG: hypothetical protein DMD35_06700 [Gemmatimonadota bacterium]